MTLHSVTPLKLYFCFLYLSRTEETEIMKLTSLEIKGFKSFGDRVIIHFDQGTTSIVGPNGSGKSNVVDAIRWVLGEQKTRMLRSEKMENIIFNGTKTRKPANLAEVTLTFENTKNILPVEYSTVSITRKLFRDGDSEYYLNGVHCRLKDITDLFMDTGIGPDSYSIIELKMVDDILNDKNNTIKMLLEEAAGISKYKLRKKQTLSKLEETEGDLNRVNDLLFEIEKSMKQLEAQAKKTARYYRLKEEYKQIAAVVAWHSLLQFKMELEEAEKKELMLKDDKTGIHSKIATLEAALEKLKTESLDKEKNLSAAQKEMNEMLLRISKLESEENARKEKIRFLSEKEIQLEAQIEKDATLLTELEQAIENLQAERLAEQARCDLASNELNELKELVTEKKSRSDEAQKELAELNKKLMTARQDLNDYETILAINHTKKSSLNEEIARIKQQTDELNSKLTETETAIQQILPEKENLEKECKQTENDLQETEQRSESENGLLARLNEKLIEEKRQCDARINEYELTKNLVEQMDGYPESIKFLKKSESRLRTVPLVSEIINCREEFKVAIENYLEPFLNHFVVNSRQEAHEAIAMLRNQNQGRAQFFVLDSLNHRELASYPSFPSCVRALDVIEFSPEYARLFDLLMGHVYITDDENSADLFDFSGLDKAVLITRSGHYIRQKYSVSGGSIGLFDGKRTGKLQNLEKLAHRIEQHRQEMALLETAISESQSKTGMLKIQKQTLTEKRNHLNSQLRDLTNRVSSFENKKMHLQESMASSQRTMTHLESQLQALEAGLDLGRFNQVNIEDLKGLLTSLSDEFAAAQQKAEGLLNEFNEATARVNQHNIIYLQLQNKVQNITRDIGYKTSQQEHVAASLKQQQEELVNVKKQLQELSLVHDSGSQTLLALLQDKQAYEATLNRLEEDYYNAKGDIDREEKYIHELRKQGEQTDAVISSLHEQATGIKMKLLSMKERMEVEFGINIETMEAPETDEHFNLEETRQRMEKVKVQIENFGPVNPMALESFNEVKERFDFIVKEKTDLLQAKESLLQTISEIDTTARERFMESYHKIRANFIEVFRSLFSEEDNCDLVLLDHSQPLESDIQIIAQPKGKRPLSIHQLSGGEKTLTATALLFGIYLLKPSPFCIFDEVDAPLDDTNIDKFNRIIRKFSGQSQFIIITHNKRTMAATDIMYGVTMAETGITQVVPVDLKSYEMA